MASDRAMPKLVCPDEVAAYASAFGDEPKLATLGFSFLCDVTGKLFKSRRIQLKDMNGNAEALITDLVLFVFGIGVHKRSSTFGLEKVSQRVVLGECWKSRLSRKLHHLSS